MNLTVRRATSALLLLGGLICLPCLYGCGGGGSGSSSVPTSSGSPSTPSFDGDTAYGFLTSQTDLGVRPPNSPAHDKCRQYLLDQLAPYVDKVDTQNFTFQDDARQVMLSLTNVIGVINPNASKKVMLFTHWDTRPTADEDPTPANRTQPILGADDGASGTAVLLELARVFHQQRPNVGVILMFEDGEDWGHGDDKMYIGSKYFVAHPGVYKPDYAVLLDMVGDRSLDIYREVNSQNAYPTLNDKVFGAAASLGYGGSFHNTTKWQITDDHIPLLQAGIPAIDLIDFDYPYWHTLQDTPDKCSARSLKIVGDVMAEVVYAESGT